MSDATHIDDVIAGCAALAAAGLSDMVWGHPSVRDNAGRGVWMKAAGYGFEEIDANHVVLVSWGGEVLVGTGRRHIEYPIHAQPYLARPDVHAVVHTHAPALAAFASLDVPLQPLSHDGVPFTHPQLPRLTSVTGSLIATAELGEDVATALGSANAILLPSHGAVTVGPDIATAVMYSVLLERACRTQLDALAAGGAKIWTDAAETAFKRDQVWNPTQLHAGFDYLVRSAGRTRAFA
ncbi:ribulose phosphate epimerase [Microbacterium sp. Root61]|uniref:class II aldolase/adducin family protein n=1 Tax=Microbacterium sp. Root61 TaxID=1736570 RepID=UPI0006FE4586|nr:class II aldolase/adducin family protein [Microbacterium sp. Root61]KRA24907.1 ribulose phosphate epimerase [Microbacterium sp. Root61]